VREVRVMRVSGSKAPRLCSSTAGRQLQLVGRAGSLPLILGHKPQSYGLQGSCLRTSRLLQHKAVAGIIWTTASAGQQVSRALVVTESRVIVV
jgi:hypothetical protein